MKLCVLFLVLLGIISVKGTCTHEHDHPVAHAAVSKEEISEFQSHVKELKNLAERTRLAQQLSALAFYQDFVVNTELHDWSWLCEEFLTHDVNMTIYTTNGTYTNLTEDATPFTVLNYVGCDNVVGFYNHNISGMFGFMYHPYANPWIEIFDNGTANTLVSGLNNAVVKRNDTRIAFWSFAYYAFGWVHTDHGWRINRFDHLSTFTIPYQGAGWATVPVPFNNVYDMVLDRYPLLGKHFKHAISKKHSESQKEKHEAKN